MASVRDTLILYNFSEEADIKRFEPRTKNPGDTPVVWAVSAERLRNYFLPRDCPRVTFFAGAGASAEDQARLLGDSAAVVAFETSWLERVRRARLFCYHLPSDHFHCTDRNAGYYQSQAAVEPMDMDVIDDCLAALAAAGVEIRIVPSLWALHDAVLASTLSYSFIRMRNATPREGNRG